MNYDYTGAIINHFIKHELSSQGLVDRLSHQLMLYRDQTNAMMFNVLDSHDTARIMTLANEDDQLVRQTLAFTFLQPGSPSIYYGTEYGMTGGNDPDCRKPMNWYPDAKAIAMHDFVRDLIKWRKEHWQLIAQGTIELTALNDNQGVVIKRRRNNQQLVAVLIPVASHCKLRLRHFLLRAFQTAYFCQKGLLWRHCQNNHVKESRNGNYKRPVQLFTGQVF